MGNLLHLDPFKPADVKKQTACQENHDTNCNHQAEDIARSNHQGINGTQER